MVQVTNAFCRHARIRNLKIGVLTAKVSLKVSEVIAPLIESLRPFSFMQRAVGYTVYWRELSTVWRCADCNAVRQGVQRTHDVDGRPTDAWVEVGNKDVARTVAIDVTCTGECHAKVIIYTATGKGVESRPVSTRENVNITGTTD